jgi:outer membrane protein insertion porin family
VKVGQPLRLADVRAALDRLYATGRYAQVTVDALEAPGGVALRFLTKPYFFIGHVSVDRVHEPPTEGALVNVTRLELGARFDEAEIQEAIRRVSGTLRRNGFYEAKVAPRYERDPVTQQIRVHFAIETGTRARYRTPVVTGHPDRPVEEIAAATHWKGWFGWKTVNAARTQDGVQRVRRSYQKKDRLESRVQSAGMNYDQQTGRVTPALNVEAGPKVDIAVTGAKVSKGKLRQLIPVYEEHSVDRDLLVEGKRNLTDYFQSQGYFNAKVGFSTSGGESQRETIAYQVDRGSRHKVTLVAIEGNQYFDTETLRERMYVRPASILQFRHGRYSEALLREDLDAIAAVYRSNGFRDVDVTSRIERARDGVETHMGVAVRIAEGPQWLVGKLDLQGVSPENREQIEGMLQSTPGQAFSEANLAIDRDNALDWYYNNGYPNATMQWSFSPTKDPHRVDVKYAFEEGERRFVRGALVSGLRSTYPDLVEKRISLRTGEPLSRAKVLDTQLRLYELGIFSRVDTALQNPQGEEPDKYVLVDVDEARKYTVTAGLGAEIARIGGCRTCLDQPAGEAGFSPRATLGIVRRNFLGQGHIVSLQGRASTLQQRAVLSYQAPQFRGNPDVSLLFSGLFDDSRDVRTFTAQRREVSVQMGQKISRASTLLYRLSFRRVSVSDLKISSIELIPLFSQPARIGSFAVNLIQDRRDDPTDSHRGVYNTVDAGWAARQLGSQTAFTRLILHNSTYHSLGMGGRFVLARAITFGWEQRLNGPDIPLPERFFGGGAQSHRGFPENQAGPRDPQTGYPLGGKALLTNQVELRFPLIGDSLRGVLFEDAGNVYSGLNTMSLRVTQPKDGFNYMVHAVGFGFRYRTPVGPVRLDLAYSINPPKFFGFKGTLEQLQQGTGTLTNQRINHIQFHFSLGQAF